MIENKIFLHTFLNTTNLSLSPTLFKLFGYRFVNAIHLLQNKIVLRVFTVMYPPEQLQL